MIVRRTRDDDEKRDDTNRLREIVKKVQSNVQINELCEQNTDHEEHGALNKNRETFRVRGPVPSL